MGKLKTKYPVEVVIEFFLFLENSQLLRETYRVRLDSGSLLYSHVHTSYEQFIFTNEIKYETYMFFQQLSKQDQCLIHVDWTLNINEIEDRNRYIMIRVKSHTQHMKELIYEELGSINTRIQALQHKINTIQVKQETQLKIPTNVPNLHHTSSLALTQSILPDKDLDIGILFSEPIFDEKKHKEANMPVDFRSEIQRLYSALNNSYKPQITVQCQIGTKQHLKHLIGLKKPKILHIICHGSKDGQLQFEDDSKFAIGSLCTIESSKIREILNSQKDSIPKLVFVNSCYSQLIGRVFYQIGAKYVIMIDSQDKIDDEAAQIFSENFYRNIFRGQKVGFSFKQAKDTVGLKHNSFGCCCRHTSREKHKQNCRWLSLAEQMGEQQAHKLYHIPSEKCVCELRNLNRHKLTCDWAQFSLFHINKDFRIKGENGEQHFPKKKSELPAYLPNQKKELMICCCFNFQGESKEPRIPHSQCNKFKMLPADEQNTEPLYQLQKNVYFRTQIIDYSAPELTEYHEKVQNSSVMGRQQELYEFMKKIKDPQIFIFILYGHPGVGKTSFSIKTATYLIERRVYEIYFFIDLYDIKDRDMFRNKFNEVTKFGYPTNRSSLNEVRGKHMLIIFDNADQFFIQSMIDFQDEIDGLRKQFFHTKFFITCKQKNISALQNEPILINNCFVKELKVLDQNVAARALFSKIRNYLDISIEYMDIRGLIATKKQLQIPKIIENLSHSFSNLKNKIKLNDLKKKIDELGNGDFAFNKLVQQNLNILKLKCKQSYEMLIFISQFSQGIDQNDFNILSMYDRSEGQKDIKNFRERFEHSIDIPIDKNWRKRLAVLFQRHSDMVMSQITKDSETDSIDSPSIAMQKHTTSWDGDKSDKDDKSIEDSQLMFKGQSYFLQELSRSRFIVKRFIRDFIWNKDNSDQNFYMKHIFVAYTAVMLDIYLKFLVEEKYIHQEILEYSDISQAGVFKYKDNNYIQSSLTESIRYVEEYNSKFQKILKQQPALKEKIRGSDPSVFILNHKLDFLHIYGYDWSKVYEYLDKNRKREASILVNYIQKLIILIPTALKIANVEDSLIQYSIRQSIQLLAQIRKFSKPNHTLLLTLKLKLMKAGHQLQKGEDNIIPNTEFQRDFHKNDLQQINPTHLNIINTQFRYEVQLLIIYKQYINSKQLKKASQQSLKAGADRLIETIKKLQTWIGQQDDWKNNQTCQVLHAKRQLVLAMIYNKILQVSTKYIGNLIIVNFKKQMTPIFILFAESAAKLFLQYQMIKLGLRAKLIGISISWQSGKSRAKQTQFNKQLEDQRQKLKDCQEIYEQKKNNLIGLTFFDILIKKIKKEMKQKMWQQSLNSLIFMKASPLSNKRSAILQNIVRKKQKYRKQLQAIFTAAEIDMSIKFQILTSQKLEQESKKGCTILLLNTNVKLQNSKLFLIFEGNDIKQKYVELNADFLNKFPVMNCKLFILMGSNANQGVKRLMQIMKSPPSMISITSFASGQFDDFQQFNYEQLAQNNPNELKKVIDNNKRIARSQIDVAKQLISSMIDRKNNKKSIKEIFDQMKNYFNDDLKKIKVDIIQNNKDIIQLIKGNFKNLSPGYRKAHNIDVQFKDSQPLIYRKWKQINQVFRELSSPKEPKYIHVCGGNGVGKSTFLQEIGRMFVERGMFQSGVYILNGKDIEQKYQSDFESYIIKNSESGNLFTLQSFNKYANSKFMLMIDDFHIIKPRSNGRYNIFLNRLIEKKVNLVLATHETFNIRDIFPTIKSIRIEKLNDVQLQIYAFNILDLQNPQALQQYQEQKRKKKLSVQDILRLHEQFKSMKGNSLANMGLLKLPNEEQLKRMVSNRS